jgi:hypothetical protein
MQKDEFHYSPKEIICATNALFCLAAHHDQFDHPLYIAKYREDEL